MILGAPITDNNSIYNAGIFLHKKKKTIIYKNKLPNYGVFDEKRVFKSGNKYNTIKYKGFKLGLLICEDMWFSSLPLHLKRMGQIFLYVLMHLLMKQKNYQREYPLQVG